MGLEDVELVIAVEEEFGIAIDDSHAPDLVSVGKLFDYTLARIRERGDDLNREIAWTRFVSVIVEQLGVPEDLVVPDAEFVRDLGIG
jgi:acyl carrier protein